MEGKFRFIFAPNDIPPQENLHQLIDDSSKPVIAAIVLVDAAVTPSNAVVESCKTHGITLTFSLAPFFKKGLTQSNSRLHVCVEAPVVGHDSQQVGVLMKRREI